MSRIDGAPMSGDFVFTRHRQIEVTRQIDAALSRLLRLEDQAKRLKELEKENARLKKLLADAELDKAILKEAASGRRRRCAA